MKGTFVISLDFEGMWGSIGGLSTESITAFEKRVSLNDIVIPRLLDLFSKYGIHATWATVGGMLCERVEQVSDMMPRDIYYPHWDLSIKEYINGIENETLYLFRDLIFKVYTTPNQELGSHTFSHYYGDENGSSRELFKNELSLSRRIFKENGIEEPVSLVMPRNQVLKEDFDIVAGSGFRIVRGRAINYYPTGIHKLDRILNFIDSYFPLFHRSYKLPEIKNELITNVRASALFRTYFKKLSFLEPLRLWRIKQAMTSAAKKGEVYHLWFHPHNMASNIEYNFKTLEKILNHFAFLNSKYGFESKTMKEIAEFVNG